ncbi:hypothetical protein [Tritonibacter mobilis]|uniref:hypothetical protein n=1 Tax=Tritonibacter mobilis TaxID=379347 RepID=UPI001D0D1B42|nr:hypothetical protein [Tritonibacter mobilis]
MPSLITFLMSGLLAFSVTLAGSATSAQNQQSIHNVFFGFDFVLQPLAIKWACGGQREQDLSQIQMLVSAFPEDAERAELKPIVAALSKMASGSESLSKILGAELNDQQVEQLCAVARSLNIDWLTPEVLIMADESGRPEEQEKAWAGFFAVVEGFQ